MYFLYDRLQRESRNSSVQEASMVERALAKKQRQQIGSKMEFEHYIQQGQQKLRCGYTTGTCAALAGKAAVRMLLGGQKQKKFPS